MEERPFCNKMSKPIMIINDSSFNDIMDLIKIDYGYS
jgi:hypothetical protein